MLRRIPNWWLILLWIPVVALALGLVSGCATTAGDATAPVKAQPSHAELQRLVAQELDADSRFDSFAAADSNDARQIAAIFRPVLADVNALDCRAAPAGSLDCTLEVVMRFPGMDGRESRTYWERRLRQIQGHWQLVGLAQP
jgi:hypothetical protein